MTESPVNPVQLSMGAPLRPHRNHHLFSDHYLGTRLRQSQDWQNLREEAIKARTAIQKLYDPLAAVLPRRNEGQLEDEFIRPVLRVLGHVFLVQTAIRTPVGSMTPDYVMFDTDANKQACNGGKITDKELAKGGLAVADAKRWGVSLDATSTEGIRTDDLFAVKNPSSQIATYITHTGLPWGVLTDGRFWRLYHRSNAHKLDHFYEVDLVELLSSSDEETFLYFYAFFRKEAFESSPLSLTAILDESLSYAQNVGESIKKQVFDALRLVAQGFLEYPYNHLTPTPDTLRDVYDNSLIVLYRLLFVLYAEARGLLPISESSDYREGYSLDARKRQIAQRFAKGDRRVAVAATLWGDLTELFKLIDLGSPPLMIATFNGGLFDAARHPFLTQYKVGDAWLERAVDLLSRVDNDFVDYRDLATRHLGTIYEGLLEYHLRPLPAPEDAGQGMRYTIELVNDDGERKSSGSYYTPDYVVAHIVREALTPVVEAAIASADNDRDRALSILRINVLDPTMGSAHFLVEATEFLAQHLATLSITPADVGVEDGTVIDVSFWKRRVAQACIYGVDLNPLAVELGKLSLWLATAAKDRPLSFLDHHLRPGNSLVGARVTTLREVAMPVAPKRKGKKAAVDASQGSFLGALGFQETMRDAVASMAAIEDNPGLTVEDVKTQERAYNALHAKLAARYGPALDVLAAMLHESALDRDEQAKLLRYVLDGKADLVPQFAPRLASARTMSAARRFFHWDIEFPDVFFDRAGNPRDGYAGFDAVVGNPPYDVVSATERGEAPEMVEEFLRFAKRDPVLQPALGGKADLFRLVMAQSLALGRPGATAGFIVPMSLLADQRATTLRRLLFSQHSVRTIHAFPQKDDARRRVFVDAKLPTCIVDLRCRVTSEDPFDVVLHPGRSIEEETGRAPASLASIRGADPDGLTIPVMSSAQAAALAHRLRTGAGVCVMQDVLTATTGELDEGKFAPLLSEQPGAGTKVLRGSNIRRYRFEADARQGVTKYLDTARYHAEFGGQRVAETQLPRFGYQRNSALDSSRRLLVTLLPTPCYCFDSVGYIPLQGVSTPYAYLALLNSDLLEWAFRLTSTNNHVSATQLNRLPSIRAVPAAPLTPAPKIQDLQLRVARLLGGNGGMTDAAALVRDLDAGLSGATPALDAVLAMLDSCGQAMLSVEREHQDTLRDLWLDLRGVAGQRDVSVLSRLWTPQRATPAKTSTPKGNKGTAKSPSPPLGMAPATVLGPLADRVLEIEDAGLLTEPQWAWLVSQRLEGLSTPTRIAHFHQEKLRTLGGG